MILCSICLNLSHMYHKLMYMYISLKLGSQYANADLTQQFIRKIEISSILRLACVCIKLM